MPYQPTLKDLLELVDFLKKSYKGNNPQRYSFIALFDEITTQLKTTANNKKIIKILLGAAVFELEAINSEYAFLSPETSSMYCLLKEKLKISPANPLYNDERLYYLTQFKKYVETFLPEESLQTVAKFVQQPTWKNKHELLTHIHAMQKYLRQKQAKHISHITHATPELIAIRQHVDNLLNMYAAKKDDQDKIIWIKHDNAKREKQLNFVRIIRQSCSYFYTTNEAKYISIFQKKEADVIKGLLLFEIMSIKSEYKWWPVPPEGSRFNKGSELYKNTLSILNNLPYQSYDEKLRWLRALLEHLANLELDTKYYQEIELEWKKQAKVELKDELFSFKTKIQKCIEKLEHEKKQPSYTKWILSSAATYGTYRVLSLGVKVLFDWGASAYTQAGVTMIATAVSGPAGIAIMIGGNLLSIAISYAMVEGVIAAGLATISASLLHRVSGAIGNKAAGVITHYQFTASKEGFAELRNKLSPEDEKAFCRFINTLLTLPEDIVSNEEKDQIKMVLPIENDGKLYPLTKLSQTTTLSPQTVTFFSGNENLNAYIQADDYQALSAQNKLGQ